MGFKVGKEHDRQSMTDMMGKKIEGIGLNIAGLDG